MTNPLPPGIAAEALAMGLRIETEPMPGTAKAWKEMEMGVDDVKKCSECGNCILQDFGYSNWTVEGTTIHCHLNLHPQGEFDRFYGHDDRDRYAEDCVSFVRSEPVWLDVDYEDRPRHSKGADQWAAYATSTISAEQIEQWMESQ